MSPTDSLLLAHEDNGIRAIQDAERKWAIRACRWSPILAIAAWLASAKYLLFILFLKPVTPEFDFSHAIHWKPSWIVGICVLLLPWIWRLSVPLSRGINRSKFNRIPLAGLLSVAWVGLVCLAFLQPRLAWFFVEWATLRTPNPSFARNTLFWEARTFEHTSTESTDFTRVGLIGSSQIYQGTDLETLQVSTDGFVFEKNCLAGFGPLQYVWLEERITERRFNTVVCWLSEFDFFREDSLPVNRLRWASSIEGCRDLWGVVDRPLFDGARRWEALRRGEKWATSVGDQWEFRGDYFDLELAATIPLWRHRDHLRRVMMGYWWNVSVPPLTANATSEPQLAPSAGMTQALLSMQSNIGRKRLVAANFRAFAQFAEFLHGHQIQLIVCEGCSHPELMGVYDQDLRGEARERLRRMANKIGFSYFDETQMPAFNASDFVDPYHLGEPGRKRLSLWLAAILTQGVNHKSSRQIQTGENPSVLPINQNRL